MLRLPVPGNKRCVGCILLNPKFDSLVIFRGQEVFWLHTEIFYDFLVNEHFKIQIDLNVDLIIFLTSYLNSFFKNIILNF